MLNTLVVDFKTIRNKDIAIVGGKNASIGEMMYALVPKGIRIPKGFATTAAAFLLFLQENKLQAPLQDLMQQLNTTSFQNLNEIGAKARELIMQAKMPDSLRAAIISSYEDLCKEYGTNTAVAVRSSATAEDLPNASFAGQHDSFLNRRGKEDVLLAVQQCFASLFNSRAIKYRFDNSFDHMKVYLSAGIQMMVRADLSASGISFTIDPESGFKDIVLISGCWGLGENIVQGAVIPDEFCVFKPTLLSGKKAILSKKMGSKAMTMTYREDGAQGLSLLNKDTPVEKRKSWVLSDDEIEQIAKWSVLIEQHYNCPMDIEWAKDGISGEIFIVQARPETIHGIISAKYIKEYILKEDGKVLSEGSAVGSGIASGKARIIMSPKDAYKLEAGEVLVTDITNPDWDPILKKAAAIVTNKGGRTSHAAIVARELGAVAVVGTTDATTTIEEGQLVTVSCANGKTGYIYDGKLSWVEHKVALDTFKKPKTAALLIVADPEKAFHLAGYPNDGVGLMRLEFIISNSIRIHPMALLNFEQLKDEKAKQEIEFLTYGYKDKSLYFIDKLSQAVATIAAAFYPKEVIVRMSDFKSNEYANLLGGSLFEPEEENPMIGFRGASRYYHDRYKEGFKLECEAMKYVRKDMGFTNVKLMIPFCRTIEEGKKVLAIMEECGLKRGVDGLEIYVMAEIPSNIILAKEFATLFDGFSIGSNDLTQLVLGLDRDSATIGELFDERNPAVKIMIEQLIKSARTCGAKVGFCGQAPSDFPELAKFLIDLGIDSISFNPDAIINGMSNMSMAESQRKVLVDSNHSYK